MIAASAICLIPIHSPPIYAQPIENIRTQPRMRKRAQGSGHSEDLSNALHARVVERDAAKAAMEDYLFSTCTFELDPPQVERYTEVIERLAQRLIKSPVAELDLELVACLPLPRDIDHEGRFQPRGTTAFGACREDADHPICCRPNRRSL
jgi:hypothetical protein